MLAFVHIEKCGGTTLDNILKRSFGIRHLNVIPKNKSGMTLSLEDLERLERLRPKIISISGHAVRPWILKKSPGSFSMYTLLRDPVQRYISDFKHFAPCYKSAGNFQKWLKLENRKNFITRSLCGEENLEKAKRVVTDEFDLIGIVEQFDEFLMQLRRIAFPLNLIAEYQVQNKAENRYNGGRKLYAQFIRKMNLKTGVDIQTHGDHINFSSYMEEIQAANYMDIQLYEFVMSEVLPAQRLRTKLKVDVGNKEQNILLREGFNGKISFLYRNLIYKPMAGYFPFWPHALPEYRSVFR